MNPPRPGPIKLPGPPSLLPQQPKLTVVESKNILIHFINNPGRHQAEGEVKKLFEALACLIENKENLNLSYDYSRICQVSKEELDDQNFVHLNNEVHEIFKEFVPKNLRPVNILRTEFEKQVLQGYGAEDVIDISRDFYTIVDSENNEIAVFEPSEKNLEQIFTKQRSDDLLKKSHEFFSRKQRVV